MLTRNLNSATQVLTILLRPSTVSFRLLHCRHGLRFVKVERSRLERWDATQANVRLLRQQHLILCLATNITGPLRV